ncbi:unnamed protein product [Urochloa decumbens]|uniref:F-box domain-containing protein n=1 Tax=Urochloa decumbens TaxID=240449 RepID=A0ABC9B5H7_9POAL
MDQDRNCPRRRRRRRHRHRSGEDYISGLPDELLRSILLRLGSARAAARTSVLSRRWRHVSAKLPELVFGNGAPTAPASSFLSVVNGALAAYTATNLETLHIIVPTDGDSSGFNGIPARRVAPWLRFAEERVAGELVLLMPPLRRPPLHEPWPEPEVDWEEYVLELPACERAETIVLRLHHHWWLRLPPAGGVFTALTSLTILFATTKGSEITALVSERCPCLRNLRLCLTLVYASDVSILSDSLRSLSYSVTETRRLEVVTPTLENLFVRTRIDEARFFAPKLERVVWRAAAYNPQRHRFDGVGRRIRLLDLGESFTVTPLMQEFDEVDELILGISTPRVCTVDISGILKKKRILVFFS